jgi:hypothetical protein
MFICQISAWLMLCKLPNGVNITALKLQSVCVKWIKVVENQSFSLSHITKQTLYINLPLFDSLFLFSSWVFSKWMFYKLPVQMSEIESNWKLKFSCWLVPSPVWMDGSSTTVLRWPGMHVNALSSTPPAMY